MPSSNREYLLAAAQAFCSSFANKEDPEKILNHFSASDDVLALEHGLPQLAPFLGREFRGQKGLQEYFQLLSSNLTYENMRFSNFVVEGEVSKVSVRGNAKFTWTSTGQSWDEVFTYVLEFDKDNKVKVYEIWAGEFSLMVVHFKAMPGGFQPFIVPGILVEELLACPSAQSVMLTIQPDSGAAFLASKGQLDQ